MSLIGVSLWSTSTGDVEDPRARKNFDTKCMNCEAVPTVGDQGLCGPCTFGEAKTAGGNW